MSSGENHFEISRNCSREKLRRTSKRYASEVVESHDLMVEIEDLEWEISTRAKRRAGAIKLIDDKPISVTLTWNYFQEKGWAGLKKTIRHELIHIHLINKNGDRSHGDRFKEMAKELNTDIHCDIFTSPKWWVRCDNCEERVPRYKKSRLIKETERYSCNYCSGPLTVISND